MNVTITQERYTSLMKGEGTLTQEEKAGGWHFCWEWDGMLIHRTWVEAKYCTCFERPEVVR